MEKFELPHRHGEKNIIGIQSGLARPKQFSAASDIFKLLSEPTRLRIFWILCHREECVINLAALLNMSSPAVFHHLRSLHDGGLISGRRNSKEVYYRACDGQIGTLLHKTVEQMMEIACPETTETYNDSPKETVRKIHEFLMTHLSDKITIDDLSKRFLLNPTTLKKAFKEVYGTSLASHMKQHRMEKAANLLTDTKMSISQVALAVGYESQSRFTASFKEAYGILPTAYRRLRLSQIRQS